MVQLGLLQACDWLLGLKVILWENHEREDSVIREICPGFYQDLDTLSKLVLLVPSARSRVSEKLLNADHSETSDKGHSERGQTSEQRTN